MSRKWKGWWVKKYKDKIRSTEKSKKRVRKENNEVRKRESFKMKERGKEGTNCNLGDLNPKKKRKKTEEE